jgi:alkanesulfonate monooxygenase SsuD/methylene tetrahydromethanopterin reductase-like flavin-dependent oxidoreductase (luciferase family)
MVISVGKGLQAISGGAVANLDFAFWDSVGDSAEGASAADVYDEHVRLAQRLEELGYHSYFVIEHQSVGAVTSPSVYLTAVARATSRLRMGAMIWQLPFYNPVRLAEEVAMLDNLSRGRVEFGTGSGVHEHEFIRWGVDYYQRSAIAEEVLNIVKMAWTQDEVTYDGKFFKFDEVLPRPKPYQQPHPPIWAAVHSDASVEYAARNNYHMAKNLDTDDVVAGKFDLYRKVWNESGHSGPMPRLFLMRQVHVAPTDEQAHEEARRYLGTGGPPRVGSGPIANSRIGWGTHPRGMGSDSELPHNKQRGDTMAKSAASYEFNIENGLAIVGSPETVARRLQESQARMGYDLFCTTHHIGRMPKDLVERSIELFGKEVIPAFAAVPA